MFGIMGDPPKRAGSILPPATTRRLPERPVTSTREARIAPPFIPSGSGQPRPPAEPQIEAAHEVAAFAPQHPEPEPEPQPPEEEGDSEGVVEPAFEADSDAVLEELSARAAEEFPLDAFIVPEQAERVPTGLEGAPATPPPETTPTSSLADRLEKLSHRLRIEESDAIVRRLAGGDRLDALLAGLLAGYLAGKSEQQ